MKTDTRHQAPRIPRAFTLVELMVVIFILAVLAGILVPSVSVARTAAKQAATGALLNSIGSGLDMFKSESRLGRKYPPSGNLTDGVWNLGTDGTPYSESLGVACGAQLLVWGLAGADLIGTPGFPQSNDDPQVGTQDGDLYGTSPRMLRHGPFIDLSKTKIKKPSETKRVLRSDSGVSDLPPVIVDAFEGPVLYFQAKPGTTPGANKINEIYFHSHNAGFLDGTRLPSGELNDPIADESYFYNYIVDERARGLLAPGQYTPPQNSDSYLLITPGPDLRYGTKDDVVNFQLDRKKLQ